MGRCMGARLHISLHIDVAKALGPAVTIRWVHTVHLWLIGRSWEPGLDIFVSPPNSRHALGLGGPNRKFISLGAGNFCYARWCLLFALFDLSNPPGELPNSKWDTK